MNDTNKIITLDDARTLHPAIFATGAQTGVSNRYEFVSTEKLINNFLELGMTIHSIKSPKTHKRSNEFSKHLIRLNLNQNTGEESPQIVVINSHNRTAGLTLQFGIFRFVCENGLIVADSNISKFHQKHLNVDTDTLYTIMNNAVSESKSIFEKIDEFKKIMLTENQKLSFVKEALIMIYNENSGRYELNDFIVPKREEDSLPTLYNCYNVIQENYMKGGTTFHTKKGLKKSKAIYFIEREVNVNILLWALMENYYQKLK